MARIGLVLGAGGVVGQAYHGGVLRAITEVTGWDPRDAEIVVGTSAGSIVGSMLRLGVPARDLAARAMGEPPSPEGARVFERIGPPQPPPQPRPRDGWPRSSAPGLLLRSLARPWAARWGTVAAGLLPAGRVPTEPMRESFRRIMSDRWPEQPLWICAVSLADGQRAVFGHQGAPPAPLADAVGASCAIPGFFEPVDIGGVRYVDGGAWSPTNLDLLAGLGLDLVVCSSPMSVARSSGRAAVDLPGRMLLRLRLADEARRVRGGGTDVIAFQPTDDDRAVMGFNAMDFARRGATARQAYTSTRRRLETASTRSRLSVLSA